MENCIDDIMHKPHVVSVGSAGQSIEDLKEAWRARAVRYVPDTELLLREVARLPQRKYQAFIIYCFTARGFNFNNERSKPSLQTLFDRAQQEGFQLFTPEALFQLSLRQTPALHVGKACLVSMMPIENENKNPQLPILQTIHPSGGEPVTMVRMTSGDLCNEWSLDMPILFLKQL
ncbi:MAG: hypothetical protein RL538_777 [Candidatus Parcubacteria bacterium]|jgi:hypothetical protein